MSRLFSKHATITRKTASGVDAAGRPTTTTSTTTTKCGYRHRLASDTFDGGLVVTDEITFYFPAGTVATPGDTITIDGDLYEVVSEPFHAWNHRTGATHHVEIRGRMVSR